MSNNISNVSAGKPAVEGAIFCAPTGTTLPTSPDESLNSAFKCLGYISDAGVTNSKTRSTSEIKAWGGDVVLVPQESKTDQFKFKFIEVLNLAVLKVVYGADNVEGSSLEDGITLHENNAELDHWAWVIDRILTNGTKSRTVIADGQPISVEDVSYVDNDVVGFDTTVQAFPTSSLNGDTHVEYLKFTEDSDESES